MGHFATYEIPDDSLIGWVRIEYYQYWDFARRFALDLSDGFIYVFDSDFVDKDDEWSDFFEIYRIRSTQARDLHAAVRMRNRDMEFIRRVPVSSITLDKATRKTYAKLDVLKTALTPDSAA